MRHVPAGRGWLHRVGRRGAGKGHTERCSVCGAIEVMWLIEVTPGARRSRSSQDGSSRVGHPRFRSTCYTLRSVPTDAEYFRFVEMLSDLCTRNSKSCAGHSVQLRHQDRGNGRTRGDETDQGAPVQCACHSCVSRMYASVSRDGGLGMALVLVRHSLLMDGLIDEHVYCNMQVGARTVQL